MEKARRAISYIRFSSNKQIEGDSITRQSEKAAAYCARHGLEMNPKQNISDFGMSGFTGAHLEKGAALGDFLSGLEQGLIPPDIALIVENLDRLSRLKAWDTVALLNRILNLGVEIHIIDLRDMVLRPGNVGDADLLYVAIAAIRAHDESARKSELGRGAHASRRKRLSEGAAEILHGSVPWWCKIDDDIHKVVAIPERAATVRRIYEMAAGGISSYQIARKLNEEGIPTHGSRSNWISFKVREIIHSNAPLGKLEPRVRRGRPVHDWSHDSYYPTIVDADLAARARAVVKRNKVRGRESTGHLPVNMLRGLIRHKTYSLRFANQRNGPAGPDGTVGINSYYEAFDETAAKRRMVYRVSAHQVESMLLAVVGELKAEDLIPPKVDPQAGFLEATQHECDDLERSITRMVAGLRGGDSPAIADAIRSDEAKLKAAKARMEKYSVEREQRNAVARTAATTLDELKELAREGDNAVRERIGSALRRLISRIYIGEPGTKFWDDRADEFLHDPDAELEVLDDETLNFRLIPDPIPDSKRRRSLGMRIFFASGTIRMADRIGADWRDIAQKNVDGDSDRCRYSIRLLGASLFYEPRFDRASIEEDAFINAVLDAPVELPASVKKLHRLLKPQKGSE